MSDDVAMAVTTSGCGEHLIKTNLAREISRQLLNSSCPTIAITKCFNEDFIRQLSIITKFFVSSIYYIIIYVILLAFYFSRFANIKKL